MFNKLVARVLSSFSGKFLNGVSQEDLRISLFSGSIDLENLSLKADVFAALDLPFSVERSLVRALRVTLPWRALRTSPVCVEVDGLYLVARPSLCCRHWTPDEVERQLQRSKQAVLDAFEQQWQLKECLAEGAAAEEAPPAEVAPPVDSWAGFAAASP